jgi:hypothetical protein
MVSSSSAGLRNVQVVVRIVGRIRHGRRAVVLDIDVQSQVAMVVLAEHDEPDVLPRSGRASRRLLVERVEIATLSAAGIVVIDQLVIGARLHAVPVHLPEGVRSRKAAFEKVGIDPGLDGSKLGKAARQHEDFDQGDAGGLGV